jgi:hypothetical protein
VEASPASAKCTVRMIRAGLVEAEESVEDGLVLVLSEDRFHVFNVFYVGKSRDMVEEEWCGPVGNVSVNLESRATADFPGVEIIVGSDGTVIFESLDKEGVRCGGAPWVVPGVSSRCICKGGYEVGRPDALSEEFTVRAVDEAGTEGSA